MDENRNIEIINSLIENSTFEDFTKDREIDLNSNEIKNSWNKYRDIVKRIKLHYIRKNIAEKIKDYSLSDSEEKQVPTSNRIAEKMKTNSNTWIQYPIMVVVSIIISWLVFSILYNQQSQREIDNSEVEAVQTIEDKDVNNTLVSDEAKKSTNIMGLAINRSGFYILPYSVTKLAGVFGCVESMTNKLPLNIIWDDAEYGLAIAHFADKNFEKLSSLPYYFSKSDYFLGEELLFVFSTSSSVIINQGIVFEDDPESYFMKVHLSLTNDVYGAVALNKAGEVVGICEMSNDNEMVRVVKSKAVFKIVKDMNLDKGVSYISLPSQNYFRNKSNAKRVESLRPFISWYKVD